MKYKMHKEIEKYSEELILFTYHEIINNGHYRNSEWFNFEFSTTEKFISYHPDETKPDGKSLISFKKNTKYFTYLSKVEFKPHRIGTLCTNRPTNKSNISNF